MNDLLMYIDGQDAIDLNDACKHYDRLKTIYEETKAEFEELQKVIKRICTQSAETSKYVVKMKVTPATSILDNKKVKEMYPEIFDMCQKEKAGYTSIVEILKK